MFELVSARAILADLICGNFAFGLVLFALAVPYGALGHAIKSCRWAGSAAAGNRHITLNGSLFGNIRSAGDLRNPFGRVRPVAGLGLYIS
jgi:hypothetical protein